LPLGRLGKSWRCPACGALLQIMRATVSPAAGDRLTVDVTL